MQSAGRSYKIGLLIVQGGCMSILELPKGCSDFQILHLKKVLWPFA